MENKIVLVKSTIGALVTINVPSANFRRDWLKKGAIQRIPFNTLQEIIFDPGVEYLFKTGILYIDDMDVKIELGLEEVGATEPVIKNYTEEDALKLLTATPLKDFRAEVQQMSIEQAKELVDVAIRHKITDYQRCKTLEEKTGTKVNKIVQEELEYEDLQANNE